MAMRFLCGINRRLPLAGKFARCDERWQRRGWRVEPMITISSGRVRVSVPGWTGTLLVALDIFPECQSGTAIQSSYWLEPAHLDVLSLSLVRGCDLFNAISTIKVFGMILDRVTSMGERGPGYPTIVGCSSHSWEKWGNARLLYCDGSLQLLTVEEQLGCRLHCYPGNITTFWQHRSPCQPRRFLRCHHCPHGICQWEDCDRFQTWLQTQQRIHPDEVSRAPSTGAYLIMPCPAVVLALSKGKGLCPGHTIFPPTLKPPPSPPLTVM